MAMNMPMPSSVARSGSMTSINRPCCSASARASSARTIGLTSLAARFARPRARLAPSPMICPRLAPARTAAASPPGTIRISSSTRGGAEIVPQSPRPAASWAGAVVGACLVDGLRVVRAFHDTACHELAGQRGAAVQPGRVGERAQPDRHRVDGPAAQASLGRGADVDDALAVEGRGIADPDGQERDRRAAPRSSRGTSRSACRSVPGTPPASGVLRRPVDRAHRAGRRTRAARRAG